MPCASCDFDDLYDPTALKRMKATKNIPSFRDLRPKPSGAQKYPFLPRHKRLNFTIGPGAIEQRPEIAKVLSRIILYWTDVEVALAGLLGKIMVANSEPSIAVYLSLRNSRQKTEALNAAAEATLEHNDLDLVFAHLRWKDTLESQRNEVAHGIFGVSPSLKDSIVWMRTTDHATFSVKVAASGLTDELEQWKNERAFVYKIGTLERIAREIESFSQTIKELSGYLTIADSQLRASQYRKLSSAPRIQKELSHIHRDREKTL